METAEQIPEVQEGAVQDNQPKGTEWVDPSKDLENDPAKVQARIDNLYKKMKKYERENQDWKRIDADRQKVIVDLQNATHVVVDHLTEKSLSETESQLKSKMQSALEAGDNAAYLDAQDKLIEVKAQKIAKQNNKTAFTPKQEHLPNPRQAAQQGFEDGDLSYEDKQYAEAWISETGDNGEPLRPWATTQDPEDPDPDHVKAWLIAQKVFTQPAYANWSVDKKLAEIDKRMGVKKTAPQQSVMGGSLTRQANNVRVTLTPKQREIAVATKFGGPKAKTDADHIAAFEKAVEKAKGGR